MARYHALAFGHCVGAWRVAPLVPHDLTLTDPIMMRAEKELCAIESVIISCVLLGGLSIQYFGHEEPCVLCLLQRFAMTGIAICVMLNTRMRPRKRHYGFALFFALLGGSVSLRQLSLHVCPDFPTFGTPFWGLSLYVWAFLVFACSIGYNGLLLILFSGPRKESLQMSWFDHLAFWLLIVATLGNVVASFDICGYFLCPR